MKPASIVFLVAIVAVVIIGIVISQKRKQRLTAETSGVVVKCDLKSINAKNSDFKTVVEYKYTVGGTDYSAVKEISGRAAESYPVGHSGVIKYNPQNPAEADVQ